ncbi:hypothetical protein G1H11_15135 [Phytoactinopolyspora alkaliphila]|uniref:Glycoside hydrolase family 3 N-terminal domain-containing protein n=1 Tax=Phytoactinopolyspora alkaliphila TaxID=1783498 RepID=A0A6N9YNU5_9ACTN|nr:glycoside hydrolase family 3 N-terminal domain-containing protein [Phytoactinopolyspora alkaliphila]NED96642.1 hypothetical protein [Phytoactinopolyspora alkaliphila]
MVQRSSRLHPSAPLTPDGHAWVDGWLDRLTPVQKAAQCLVVLPGATTDGMPDEATIAALRGGLGTLHSITDLRASQAARYHAVVGEVSSDAGFPPVFVTGNLEAGVGYSLGATGTDFPYPRGIGMAGSAALAYRAARQAAEEAYALGYRWTLSPCIDVVTTPDDPILGVRAYGVDASGTSALGTAQIRGYQDAGVLATAKHYPGHGDSAVDSHLDLPRIDRSAHDHESVHLAPFRAAAEAGVASIMVAHVVLPGLGIDVPASLSPEVNRGWLRDELGYTGVIITDSLRMRAVAARYDAGAAALLALHAGADVANVKCPAEDFPAVLTRLSDAIDSGELDEATLDAAFRRLLEARWRCGAHEPASFDASEARRYDPPLEWDDELRGATVSVRGDGDGLRRDGTNVVMGDTALASRTTELIRERGFPVTLVASRPTASSLAAVATDASIDTVVPVFSPSLPITAQERQEISTATTSEEVRAKIAAVLVNSALDAADLPDTGTALVSLPAVDPFEMVTDAAVRAAIDVLT